MKLKVAEIALKGPLNSIETHVTNQRVKENVTFPFKLLYSETSIRRQPSEPSQGGRLTRGGGVLP